MKNHSQKFFHDIMPIELAFFDTKMNILWANKSYCQSAKVSQNKILGKKCYALLGSSQICQDCPVKRALTTNAIEESEINIFNCKNNKNSIKLVKAAPYKNKNGSIKGVSAAILNISDKINKAKRYEKTAEALLKIFEFAPDHTSEELLREFLDQAEILTKSKIGFYHFVEENHKQLILQTWSTNTLKVCKTPNILSESHYPFEKAGVWIDCIHQKQSVIHNDYISLPHKKGLPQGHVPVLRELVVPVFRGGKIKAVLGVGNKETAYDEYDKLVVEQLTELAWETVIRKKKEEENKKLQEQFIQTQKMESVGRLAGGVAHDFNNMLSVILGHVDIALDTINKIHPVYENLIEIQKAANRSAHLTKQLLAFARKQPILPKNIDINNAISNMIKMLNHLIGEDIQLQWIPGENIGSIKIDPAQLDQILANLCVNARDAISGIGKIVIETKNVFFDDEYCRENLDFYPGSFVMIGVSDNGTGMTKEEQEHIFEPFYTTKKSGKGTGLGLATVYGIIKQNDGFLNIYSEPENGTIFKIYLKKHNLEKKEQESDIKPRIVMGKGETILLVEDEKMIMVLGKKILSSIGYNVIASDNPIKAIELAQKNKEIINLLITDVIMPEMNGKTLSHEIEKIIPGLKTLFMSAYTADAIAHHGVLDKDIEFIQKPFHKNELAMKVKHLLPK